jgi:hypothetical protein
MGARSEGDPHRPRVAAEPILCLWVPQAETLKVPFRTLMKADERERDCIGRERTCGKFRCEIRNETHKRRVEKAQKREKKKKSDSTYIFFCCNSECGSLCWRFISFCSSYLHI